MPRPSASRYQQRRRICAATASTPMAKCCPAFHLERSDLLLKITYSRISFRAKRGICFLLRPQNSFTHPSPDRFAYRLRPTWDEPAQHRNIFLCRRVQFALCLVSRHLECAFLQPFASQAPPINLTLISHVLDCSPLQWAP